VKKLVTLSILGLALILLLPAACKKSTETPMTEPEPAPVEGPIIEMHTKTTLAGVARYLTISADGSIVYIEEEGLRHPIPERPPIRTTRAGQLHEGELDRLLDLFDECPFDAEGKCDALTEIIDTDAHSELSLNRQGMTRTIVANYQPLFHDITALSDVPESVKRLYQELLYIVENRTTQVACEKIPVGG